MAATCTCSKAGFVLALTSTGEFGNFQVSSGSSVVIPVYLVQTAGEDRLSTVGLFSSGATVEYETASGPGPHAAPISATIDSVWTDTIANFAGIDSANKQVILEGFVFGTSPVKASLGSNSIRIGEIQFAAGGESNVTVLNISFAGNLPGINLLIDPFPAGTPLSPTFVGGTISTVSAVPEPTSLTLAGLVGGAIGLSQWRRRRDSLLDKSEDAVQ